jgi:hypothetical protein
MRVNHVVLAVAVALCVSAGAALAQGNSGCSGTIQGGAGQMACNAYGLCRAYFAGSATGQAHKHQAGPFQALVAAACSGGQDCSSSTNCSCATDGGNCDPTDECVAMFCPDTNPGGHGKNPSDGSPGQNR